MKTTTLKIAAAAFVLSAIYTVAYEFQIKDSAPALTAALSLALAVILYSPLGFAGGILLTAGPGVKTEGFINLVCYVSMAFNAVMALYPLLGLAGVSISFLQQPFDFMGKTPMLYILTGVVSSLPFSIKVNKD